MERGSVMETYIKMLSETQWIRGTGEGWQFGDRFVWGIDYGQNGIVTHLPFNTIGYPNILWLPSVEQLMEMLGTRVSEWELVVTGIKGQPSYQVTILVKVLGKSFCLPVRFESNSPHEALLQLLQYAHDGSRWDTERWVKG